MKIFKPFEILLLNGSVQAYINTYRLHILPIFILIEIFTFSVMRQFMYEWIYRLFLHDQ